MAIRLANWALSEVLVRATAGQHVCVTIAGLHPRLLCARYKRTVANLGRFLPIYFVRYQAASSYQAYSQRIVRLRYFSRSCSRTFSHRTIFSLTGKHDFNDSAWVRHYL